MTDERGLRIAAKGVKMIIPSANQFNAERLMKSQGGTQTADNDINAIKNLLPLVDDNKYYQLNNKDEAFYQKYQRLGYVNEKAKYWHHGEEPHELFADELINFNEEYKCLKR